MTKQKKSDFVALLEATNSDPDYQFFVNPKNIEESSHNEELESWIDGEFDHNESMKELLTLRCFRANSRIVIDECVDLGGDVETGILGFEAKFHLEGKASCRGVLHAIQSHGRGMVDNDDVEFDPTTGLGHVKADYLGLKTGQVITIPVPALKVVSILYEALGKTTLGIRCHGDLADIEIDSGIELVSDSFHHWEINGELMTSLDQWIELNPPMYKMEDWVSSWCYANPREVIKATFMCLPDHSIDVGDIVFPPVKPTVSSYIEYFVAVSNERYKPLPPDCGLDYDLTHVFGIEIEIDIESHNPSYRMSAHKPARVGLETTIEWELRLPSNRSVLEPQLFAQTTTGRAFINALAVDACKAFWGDGFFVQNPITAGEKAHNEELLCRLFECASGVINNG